MHRRTFIDGVAGALLAEAVIAAGEAGRSVIRMVLPPLLKPMLVDILAKVRHTFCDDS